jgi:hypothetical protein
MAATAGSYQIHSEAHGSHWVAWVSRGADAKPDRSVVLIGKTREEVEARAQAWAEQSSSYAQAGH